MWLLLTFISVISRAVYGVMTKVLSSKMNVSIYTQALLPSVYAMLISIIVLLVGKMEFSVEKGNMMLVLLVVIPQGLGNIVYYKAMQYLTSGTAQISFSSILGFNVILSMIFLHYRLSVVNSIGIILLALAILSVAHGRIEFHPKGVALMIFSTFLFSIFQLATAQLSPFVSTMAYLIISYSGAALVVFVMKSNIIVQDVSKLLNNKKLLLIPLFTALPSLGNFLFAYYAYRAAPEPAKVAMLLTSQTVFAVIISYFFLKEREHVLRKIFAALLVLASAVLIKA